MTGTDYTAKARQSHREAVKLGQKLRDGTMTEIKLALRNAAARPAFSLEKPEANKQTTLAAVFFVDFIGILTNPKKFSELKQKFIAEWLFDNPDTLAEIFRIGSIDHIVDRLGKFINPTPNARKVMEAARDRKDEIDRGRQ